MTITKEDIRLAKLRIKAKAFKNSIPIGMAIPLPDELIDSLSDTDVPDFLKILKSLRLEQQPPGYWQRDC